MNLRSNTGLSLLHLLLAIAIFVVVMNLVGAVYCQSIMLVRFIDRRCEDLQGLDLILRDIKRDAAGASGAENVRGTLTFSMPGDRKVTYVFARGTLSRNGVGYHAALESFDSGRRAPDLAEVHIRLRTRGRRPGPVISTVILMRNAHETPER